MFSFWNRVIDDHKSNSPSSYQRQKEILRQNQERMATTTRVAEEAPLAEAEGTEIETEQPSAVIVSSETTERTDTAINDEATQLSVTNSPTITAKKQPPETEQERTRTSTSCTSALEATPALAERTADVRQASTIKTVMTAPTEEGRKETARPILPPKEIVMPVAATMPQSEACAPVQQNERVVVKEREISSRSTALSNGRKEEVSASGGPILETANSVALSKAAPLRSETVTPGPQKQLFKKGKEKKSEIVNLVCEESMPVFKDMSLPVPLPKIVFRRQKLGGTTAASSRTTQSQDRTYSKKRTADPLTGNSSPSSKRPAKKDKDTGSNPTPVRANTTAAREQAVVMPPPPEVTFLEKYGPHLTYDWSELELGTINGSVAWNRALRDKLCEDPSLGSVPQVSPVDALMWVQQLQAQFETVAPHVESDLRKVVKNTKWMNDKLRSESASSQTRNDKTSGGDVSGSADSETFATSSTVAATSTNELSLLVGEKNKGDTCYAQSVSAKASALAQAEFSERVGRIFQDCMLQDVTDHRPEYQCMRSSELVERMRNVEQRAAGLHERGLKVNRASQSVGLWEKVAL